MDVWWVLPIAIVPLEYANLSKIISKFDNWDKIPIAIISAVKLEELNHSFDILLTTYSRQLLLYNYCYRRLSIPEPRWKRSYMFIASLMIFAAGRPDLAVLNVLLQHFTCYYPNSTDFCLGGVREYAGRVWELPL